MPVLVLLLTQQIMKPTKLPKIKNGYKTSSLVNCFIDSYVFEPKHNSEVNFL